MMKGLKGHAEGVKFLRKALGTRKCLEQGGSPEDPPSKE